MRTVQHGDRVRVHYVKRWQDGSVAGSREPVELTVGTDHPRVPGLGAELVGLAPGQATTLTVPSERAHGLPDPARVRSWSRERFPAGARLRPGKLVRVTNAQGRRRLVRVLEVTGKVVVVDANHRRAGQRLELEVQLVAICEPGAGAGAAAPRPGRAVAFDVDAASLASLREALPGWEVVAVHGASAASLARGGAPSGPADLLIIGVRDSVTQTLGLCRLLAARVPPSAGAQEEADEAQGPPAGAPLLVLVPREQQTLVGAALEAGARSCLVLPIHPKQVASMLAHARAGSRPGRHTLGLDPAEESDPWQEDGGEA